MKNRFEELTKKLFAKQGYAVIKKLDKNIQTLSVPIFYYFKGSILLLWV